MAMAFPSGLHLEEEEGNDNSSVEKNRKILELERVL